MSPILDLKNPAPQPQSESALVVEEQAVDQSPEEALSWEAHHPLSEYGRSKRYLLMAGVALAGGFVSYWQESWSTMLVMVLAIGAWEISERLAKPVSVNIDGRGLTVDGLHFPHANLSSFDIHQMPDGTVELSLMTDRWHSHIMRLPMGSQDPSAVRGFLLGHVPEDSHKVPLLDWWLRTPKK